MKKKSVKDVELKGRRVLVRADFNVPLDGETGEILDDFRIRAALPTVEYLRANGARTVLCSHLGRPKGKVLPSLSLRPVAKRLAELLRCEVPLADDCVGPDVERAVGDLTEGDVLLLENLRFRAEEQENEPNFARQLAALADVYVNDAFATAHRPDASVVGVPALAPESVAGLLMQQEIDFLTRLVVDIERPCGVILGGAKVSDKLPLVDQFLARADVLVIGGAMANTFLKAKGCSVGSSLVEDEMVESARRILEHGDRHQVRIVLPVDVVVAERLEEDARSRVVDADSVPEGWIILDIGPRAVDAFEQALQGCKTIVWNGPLGKFEWPRFANGSRELSKRLRNIRALRVSGGGETSALHREPDLADGFDYVSTGGGAFLEFLEGRELPGIAALSDA